MKKVALLRGLLCITVSVLSFAVGIYEKYVFILLCFILANRAVKVPNEDKVIMQVVPCKELIVSLQLCFDIRRSVEEFS